MTFTLLSFKELRVATFDCFQPISQLKIFYLRLSLFFIFTAFLQYLEAATHFCFTVDISRLKHKSIIVRLRFSLHPVYNPLLPF